MNDSSGWPINASPTNALRRELGRWDLALLFVVAILNLNTVSSIATSGPVALWLWLVALLCFFLPQGIAVIELSHRYPGEGGFYLWIKEVFGAMCFSLIGLELASIMGDEIRNPERTLPSAIALSGIVCGLLYVATTAALLVAIPADQIGVVQGIVEAISHMSQRVGLPWILPALATILSISVIGIASAWLTGAARLPFVFGLDRYLPPALGRLHPRYKTPHVALIAQSTVCALFLSMTFAGAAVKEAFITTFLRFSTWCRIFTSSRQSLC